MENSGVRFKITEVSILYFLCAVSLILFYTFDAVNKTLQYSDFVAGITTSEIKSLSIYVRALFEIIFLLISVLFINRYRLNFLILIASLIVIFIIGHGTYSLNFNHKYNVGYNIATLNKYIFIFLIYIGIYKIMSCKERLGKLISILEIIFVLNSLLVFLGVLFNIGLFKSYYTQYYRYGYSGLIPAINEASLFYLIAVSHFYYKKYFLHEKSYKFYVVLLASFLLGSKAIIIFNLCLLLYHIFSRSSQKQLFNALFVFFGILFSIYLFISSQLGKDVLSVFYYAVEKNGLFSMLLTGRDYIFKTKFVGNLEYWNIINYLFGGQDQSLFLIEMDLFDLFLFFGIVGFVIYLYLLFKSIFNFQRYFMFTYFFIGMYLFIGFLGGHFFSSAVNSLYLVLFCLYQNFQNIRIDENR